MFFDMSFQENVKTVFLEKRRICIFEQYINRAYILQYIHTDIHLIQAAWPIKTHTYKIICSRKIKREIGKKERRNIETHKSKLC